MCFSNGKVVSSLCISYKHTCLYLYVFLCTYMTYKFSTIKVTVDQHKVFENKRKSLTYSMKTDARGNCKPSSIKKKKYTFQQLCQTEFCSNISSEKLAATHLETGEVTALSCAPVSCTITEINMLFVHVDHHNLFQQLSLITKCSDDE